MFKNNVDEEVPVVCLTQKHEMKVSQKTKLSRNREICEPQNRENFM